MQKSLIKPSGLGFFGSLHTFTLVHGASNFLFSHHILFFIMLILLNYNCCRKHHISRHLACPHCDKKFCKQMFLKEHLYMHTPKAPYTCQLCTEKFTRRAPFQMHLLSHDSQSNLCNICGKIFENATLLRDHRVRHIKERGVQHLCNFCQKSFAQKISFIAHLQTHSSNATLSCSKCNKKFTTHSASMNHQMEHTKRDAVPAVQKCVKSGIVKKCQTCNKNFEKGFQLKVHKRSHEQRRFVCEKCTKSFSTEGNFNIHRKLHGE